jgi:hypothetical protein
VEGKEKNLAAGFFPALWDQEAVDSPAQMSSRTDFAAKMGRHVPDWANVIENRSPYYGVRIEELALVI